MDVKNLIADAEHKIDVDLLIETDSSGFFTSQYLHDSPLYQYFDFNEQIQFLLWADANDINFHETSDSLRSSYRTFVAVTHKRIIVVTGTPRGDQYDEIRYSDLEDVWLATENGFIRSQQRLGIATQTKQFEIPNQSSADLSEAQAYLIWMVFQTTCETARTHLRAVSGGLEENDASELSELLSLAIDEVTSASAWLDEFGRTAGFSQNQLTDRKQSLDIIESALRRLVNAGAQIQENQISQARQTIDEIQDDVESALSQTEFSEPAVEACLEHCLTARDHLRRVIAITPAHERVIEHSIAIQSTIETLTDADDDAPQEHADSLQVGLDKLEEYDSILAELEFQFGQQCDEGRCDICCRETPLSWQITVEDEVHYVCSSCREFRYTGDVFSPSVISDLQSEWENRLSDISARQEGKTVLSSEELTTAINQVGAKLGRLPSRGEIAEHGSYSEQSLPEEFTSWIDPLSACDLEPETAIREEIKELATELSIIPTETEITNNSRYRPALYEYTYKDITSAIEAAGFNPQSVGDEQWVNSVRSLAKEIERPPGRAEVENQTSVDTVSLYENHETWTEILREAGIRGHPPEKKQDGEEDPLLTDLRALTRELEHYPSRSELNEYGEYYWGKYKNRFESVDAALDNPDFFISEVRNPSGPLDEPPDSGTEIPSHTDLLRELLWLVNRHGVSSTLKQFDEIAQYDRSEYELQFGSVEEAMEKLQTLRDDGAKTEYDPKQQLQSGLQELGEFLGGPPTLLDLLYFGRYSVEKHTSKYRSLDQIWAATGFDPSSQPPSTDELLTDLRQIASDQPPTIAEYTQKGSYRPEFLIRRFDSWLSALNAAGFAPLELGAETIRDLESAAGRIQFDTQLRKDQQFAMRDVLVDELYRLRYELGSPLNKTLVDVFSQYPSSAFEETFGSCEEALACIDEPESTTQINIAAHREELIATLKQQADDLEQVPTQRVINARSEFSVLSYIIAFGSWTEALEAAELDPSDQPSVSKPVLRNEFHTAAEELDGSPGVEKIVSATLFDKPIYKRTFGNLEQLQTKDGPERPDPEPKSTDVTEGKSTPAEGETTDKEGQPTVSELVEELQRLDSKLSRPIKPGDIKSQENFTLKHYREVFGGWGAAMEEADLERQDALLADLERIWKIVDKPPTQDDVLTHGEYSPVNYARSFSCSWDDIVGLVQDRNAGDDSGEVETPDQPSHPTQEQLVEELRSVRKEKGARSLISGRIATETAYSKEEYITEFGSLKNALDAAGLNVQQAVLDQIKQEDGTLDRGITADDLRRSRHLDSNLIEEVFDSIPGAIQEYQGTAGRKQPTSTQSEAAKVCDAIQRVDRKVNGPITTTDFAEHSEYNSSAYSKYYDSWQEALEAAGISRREQLLSALERVHADSSQLPGAKEFTDQTGISRQLVYLEFGGWDAFIEAYEQRDGAKEEASNQTGSDAESSEPETLLEAIRSVAHRINWPIRTTDLEEFTQFNRNNFMSEYDSWDEAVEAAGVDREQRLFQELDRVVQEVGEFPTQPEMTEHSKVSFGMYTRYFGSWTATGREYADYAEDTKETDETSEPSDDDTPPPEALIDELQGFHNDVDYPIKSTDINQQTKFQTYQYTTQFGSLDAAFDVAGIDRRSDFLREVHQVAEEIGEFPSRTQFDEEGHVSHSLVSGVFGSWTDVKSAYEEWCSDAGQSPILGQTQASGSINGNDGQSISPNEVAELYDSLGLINQTLSQYVSTLDADSVDDHPTIEWQAILHDVLYEDGISDEGLCLKEIQADVNPFTMAEYRAQYGNGDQVTNFAAIETASIPQDTRHRIFETLDDPPADFQVLVSPSEKPLPVSTQTKFELQQAHLILNEILTSVLSDTDIQAKTIEVKSDPTIEIDSSESVESPLKWSEVSADEKYEKPIAGKLRGQIAHPSGNRTAELRFTDLTGDQFWLTVFDHHIDYDWVTGDWYLINNFKGSKPEGNSRTENALRSTPTLMIEHYEQLPPAIASNYDLSVGEEDATSTTTPGGDSPDVSGDKIRPGTNKSPDPGDKDDILKKTVLTKKLESDE